MKIIQPNYITKLPSTGKSVKFRPFTVKEEKSLLLALQENDIETISNSIKNTVLICTDSEVDPSKLPYYDIEYLFLKIRSKSIGETIDLIGSCECNESVKTKLTIDLESILIEPKPISKVVIKIPDTNYVIEMRHPTIDAFAKNAKADDELAEEVVASCILNVFEGEERIDMTEAETLEFVCSMSPKQQDEISKFLDAMPMVQIKADYLCSSCGKEHKQVLSGFQNFFL